MSAYVCGLDFCEECGLCMACFGHLPCTKARDKQHWCILSNVVPEEGQRDDTPKLRG